ncbi:DUF2497 domain-containing protein [Erythrobacter sp.]|uniref:DUF2497 domain-containing protein n=1 Tax=Erythrobacter sp. TaxID=1042 RepID=UPI001425CEFB|nr:DUF2497 domain-containing protein [Erythrobacter sp.]QIQ87459.1 MAG: DUF2497 domain-containing protein [Erythrobacter sp.]
MANSGEASVEEILESIKKVIARDNREDALAARRRREAEAERAEQESQSGVEQDEEVLDLSAMDFADEADLEEAAVETEEDDDAPLIAEKVRGAMQENLAALAMLAEPGAKPQIVRSGETSLEGLVREMLRPMLAAWLDENLPGMVEKMVQAEIARIAGKRR